LAEQSWRIFKIFSSVDSSSYAVLEYLYRLYRTNWNRRRIMWAKKQNKKTANFKLLEAKLLAIGGNKVMPWDACTHLLDALLTRGRGFGVGCREILKTGPGSWPVQVALEYLEHQVIPEFGVREIVLGYALVEEVWRLHEWVVNEEMVFDHCDSATHYYGFVCRPAQALGGVMEHLISPLMESAKNEEESEALSPTPA
jgi:hypothetical protein